MESRIAIILKTDIPVWKRSRMWNFPASTTAENFKEGRFNPSKLFPNLCYWEVEDGQNFVFVEYNSDTSDNNLVALQSVVRWYIHEDDPQDIDRMYKIYGIHCEKSPMSAKECLKQWLLEEELNDAYKGGQKLQSLFIKTFSITPEDSRKQTVANWYAMKRGGRDSDIRDYSPLRKALDFRPDSKLLARFGLTPAGIARQFGVFLKSVLELFNDKTKAEEIIQAYKNSLKNLEERKDDGVLIAMPEYFDCIKELPLKEDFGTFGELFLFLKWRMAYTQYDMQLHKFMQDLKEDVNCFINRGYLYQIQVADALWLLGFFIRYTYFADYYEYVTNNIFSEEDKVKESSADEENPRDTPNAGISAALTREASSENPLPQPPQNVPDSTSKLPPESQSSQQTSEAEKNAPPDPSAVLSTESTKVSTNSEKTSQKSPKPKRPSKRKTSSVSPCDQSPESDKNLPQEVDLFSPEGSSSKKNDK